MRGRCESKILCRQSGPREPGVLRNTGGKRNATCIQADLRAPLDLRFRAGPERTRCRWALPRASNCGRQRCPDLPARRGPLASREGRRGTLESLPVDQGRLHRWLHGDRLQERFSRGSGKRGSPGGGGRSVTRSPRSPARDTETCNPICWERWSRSGTTRLQPPSPDSRPVSNCAGEPMTERI